MAEYALYKKYFVRQAVMPLSKAEKNPLINDNEAFSIDEICRNPFFRQAILCASESLYDSMNDYLAGKINSTKRKRQVESALCQYWMRMSTRATPFGLFSSVSISTTDLENKPNGYYAVVDADCEWILILSKIVENKYLEHFSFITNDLVCDNGVYYKLPYVPGADDNSSTLVEKNRITTYIVEQCARTQKSYYDLLEGIQLEFPEIDSEHIRYNIQQLLSRDIILSPLRPNLHCPNLIGSFYKQLEENHIANELTTQLADIIVKIDYVSNHIFTEDAEQELLLLISSMRKINNTAHVLKIDLRKEATQCVINKENIADIEDFANFFVSALTHLKSKFTVYNEYKDVFLNEYGDYKMVQLSKLIDPKLGIGLPHTFKEFRKKKRGQRVYKNEPSPQFLYYFMKKYRQAIQNGTAIIIDDMLDQIGLRDNLGDAPESFDLIFKVATDDEGKRVFVCNKDFGCIGAGRTIGRFSANWKEAADIMKDISLAEHTDEDYVVCDLVYMPKRVHLGNVATGTKIYEYSLSFFQHTTLHHLPISDLYVMIENNKFQLVSKRLGRKIKINTSNLLYYFGDSPEIRFIKEIQFDGIIRWEYDTFDSLLSFDYMPEIRYKSIIIRPETWIIVPSIQFDCFNDFDKWFVEEYDFLKNKRISLLYADNELLIDVKKPQCRYLIYKQYLHERKVTITKYHSSKDLAHATEVSLPFVRKVEKEISGLNGFAKNKDDSMVQFVPESLLALGEEDITIKLYGCPEPEIYIATQLKKLVDSVISAGLADSYFFLHYADPKNHIRIRFLKKDGNLDVESIVRYFNKHVRMGLICSFEMCSYAREFERYGGHEGIYIAEEIFYFDSQCAINFLTCKADKQREKLFVLLALDYMKIWEWNDEKQFLWLDERVDRAKYSVQWRRDRDDYNKFYAANNDSYLPEGLYDMRNVAFQNYRLIICDKIEEQERILSALLHMSFNRLFGMNREKETRLLTYVRNLLHDILIHKNLE